MFGVSHFQTRAVVYWNVLDHYWWIPMICMHNFPPFSKQKSQGSATPSSGAVHGRWDNVTRLSYLKPWVYMNWSVFQLWLEVKSTNELTNKWTNINKRSHVLRICWVGRAAIIFTWNCKIIGTPGLACCWYDETSPWSNRLDHLITSKTFPISCCLLFCHNCLFWSVAGCSYRSQLLTW